VSLCALCGLTAFGDGDVCDHHADTIADTWALANRVICDLVHRKIAPQRLEPEEREEDQDSRVI
jgi:hypothetical protein